MNIYGVEISDTIKKKYNNLFTEICNYYNIIPELGSKKKDFERFHKMGIWRDNILDDVSSFLNHKGYGYFIPFYMFYYATISKQNDAVMIPYYLEEMNENIKILRYNMENDSINSLRI